MVPGKLQNIGSGCKPQHPSTQVLPDVEADPLLFSDLSGDWNQLRNVAQANKEVRNNIAVNVSRWRRLAMICLAGMMLHLFYLSATERTLVLNSLTEVPVTPEMHRAQIEGKPRIAVVVNGMPRTLDTLIENQIWGLTALSQDMFEVDVFYYLSAGRDLQADANWTTADFHEPELVERWNSTLKTYGANLVHISMNNDANFPPEESLRPIACNERSSMLSVARQFRSLADAYKAMEKYELQINRRYNYVVRMRTDAMFLEPVNIPKLLDDYPDASTPTVWLPIYGSWGGLHDRFAVMDRGAAISYFYHRYTYWESKTTIRSYMEPFFRELPNGEAYLRAALLQDRITVHQLSSFNVYVAPRKCFSYKIDCKNHHAHPDIINACEEYSCKDEEKEKTKVLDDAAIKLLQCQYYHRVGQTCPFPKT